MNWIDRAALVWAAFLWIAMYLLAAGHGEPQGAFNIEVYKAILILAGIPWLALRGVAFIATGRLRRY